MKCKMVSVISLVSFLLALSLSVYCQSLDASHKALRLLPSPDSGLSGGDLAGAEITLKKIGAPTELKGYLGPDGTLLRSSAPSETTPLAVESGDWVIVFSLKGYEIFTFDKHVSEGIPELPNPEASEFVYPTPISRPIKLTMDKDPKLSMRELTGASVTILGKKGGGGTIVGHLNADGIVLNDKKEEITLGPGDYTLRIAHEVLLGTTFPLTVPDTSYKSPAKYVAVRIGPKKSLITIQDLIPALGPESIWEYVTTALALLTIILLVAILAVIRHRRAASGPVRTPPAREGKEASQRPRSPKIAGAPGAASTGEGRFAGRRFGNYLVTRTIARGGMAYVTEARFEREGKTHRAALKIPYEDYQQDEEFKRRFDQEGSLGDILFHENIIEIYEYGKNKDDIKFIAMEYIDGCDLRDLLKKKKKIEPKRAAQIVMDIAKALDYAHGQSPPVYHRDIKPENIMFRDKPARGKAILTDFGIASQGMTMGTGKALIGTALYTCPDAVKGSRVSPAYDIYSLGVVFYEMLTGRPPFTGDSYYAIMRRHEDEIPKSPMKINRKVPVEIDRIVMKMLEKDPRKRYTTAKSLLRALRDYLKGQG